MSIILIVFGLIAAAKYPWLGIVFIIAGILRFFSGGFKTNRSSRSMSLCEDTSLYQIEKPTGVSVDEMSGEQFERWCASLLIRSGFQNVSLTKATGDMGVDIIAYLRGYKFVFQCKRYAKPLGNKPVQEIVAGRQYYLATVASVITNNYFTDGAKKLAESNRVCLIDRKTLSYATRDSNYLERLFFGGENT